MFLLDTNVVSELRKAGTDKVNPNVEKWSKSVLGQQTFISTITIFELERGVLLMERRDPKQGNILRQWLNSHVLAEYSDRIIPISVDIARRCAALHVPDPMPYYDALIPYGNPTLLCNGESTKLIAATALEHCLTVATRNTEEFDRIGVKLFNPWILNGC